LKRSFTMLPKRLAPATNSCSNADKQFCTTSEEQTLFATDIAREIVGSEHVDDKMQPVMGAEDFAFMLRKVPGCYVFLGSGRQDEATPRQLHNPHYDFNDGVIADGVRYWVRLAERYLLQSPSKS
jgi:hippurate hydrolase